MRTLLVHIIFLLALPLFGQQNLAPNPSFEDTINCGFSTTFACADWYPLFGSPDFYKTSTSCWSTAPVPYNAWGFQYPRTGNSYLGADMYCDPIVCAGTYREAFQAMLLDTLKENKRYCISLYTCLAEECRFATDDIGVKLSSTSGVLFPTTMQIWNNEGSYIIDTSLWTRISGTYTSVGNEIYISVGNFKSDQNTTTVANNPSSPNGETYYYFDDIAVIELPEIDAGSNQTIFPYETATLSGNCEGCWTALQYAWYPSVGLSDSTILNPTANPEVTTTYYLTLIDTTGNVQCMSDVIDSVTVFVEPGPNLIVFPNPSTQNENINYYVGKVEGSNISILLHDLKGKLVYKKENIISDSEYELDLHLAAGVYTLSLFSDSDLIETKKLVIEE